MSNRPNSKRISASHFALRPMSDTMLSDFLDLMKIKMASITIQMPIVIGNCLLYTSAYHELLKGTYFDRVDDMPKYIKYRVSTLSGNIAGDYKDYLPQKTEVVNDIIVTYRMVDDFVYLASWEHGGQSHVFL